MGLTNFEKQAFELTGKRAWRMKGELCSPAQVQLYSWAISTVESPSFRRRCQYILDGMTGVVQERRSRRLREFMDSLRDRQIFTAIARIFKKKEAEKYSAQPPITSPRQRKT